MHANPWSSQSYLACLLRTLFATTPSLSSKLNPAICLHLPSCAAPLHFIRHRCPVAATLFTLALGYHALPTRLGGLRFPSQYRGRRCFPLFIRKRYRRTTG
ncbi:hypothetical protein BC939DRAFT_437944 [Gamsiella multidivaricata]|uniref:uncharacterized protein n=1 Tax=Gamsiella multidivaricata TaxID=101098 RepID=UPI002220DD22|nr:uncharacterized protein BC939DRAFT_437944 [Gamsiella multidivaricata]KAI7831218.1 hypothetical protein BC939DRAFT_437944 [Gamsiella multidivaricata]